MAVGAAMSVDSARHFRDNLRIERDNAALYARLAALAGDVRSRNVYRRIAAGERANARFWVSAFTPALEIL